MRLLRSRVPSFPGATTGCCLRAVFRPQLRGYVGLQVLLLLSMLVLVLLPELISSLDGQIDAEKEKLGCFDAVEALPLVDGC